MKNSRKLIGFIIIAVVILSSIIAIACDDLGGESTGGGNPFIGIWSGMLNSYGYDANAGGYQWGTFPATINLTETEWYFRCPSIGWYESGAYSQSGNTATLRAGYGVFGTATISGNRLLLVDSDGDSSEFTRQ
jgi:hypothetical protein